MNYHTFIDAKSFDHGNYSVEILEKNNFLRQFIETEQYDTIIKKAIKNHNKRNIEEGVSKQELLFCKIIRDADKLDIIQENVTFFFKGVEQKIESEKISDAVWEQFQKEITIDNQIKETDLDWLVGHISFIYDINFEESFRMLKQEKHFERMMKRFHFSQEETKKRMEAIQQIAIQYINKQTEHL